ncbi:MAG TPA: inositol monophosphatase family protein [Candidatus Dormibacteraeota bacterium]|nr:inositol monophosphatase family protein [Candidatus Dormibacteraeota bacterium]
MIEHLAISEQFPKEAVSPLVVGMKAAYLAGRIINEGYGGLHEVTDKGHGDLVSEVDVACDEVITTTIRASDYGDEVIISEELNPDAPRPEAAHWIVDPLDSSNAFEFMISEDMPAVLIARQGSADPDTAVVYFPLTSELFIAVEGYGSYKGENRLQCANTPPLDKAWVELNQYSNAQLESPLFAGMRNRLRTPGRGARLVTTRAPHSGVGVRIAESGQAISAVVHDNGPSVKQGAWDVAAVALVLKEAGGVVLNFKGEAYDPFKPEPFLMAASPELAEEIIDLAA